MSTTWTSRAGWHARLAAVTLATALVTGCETTTVTPAPSPGGSGAIITRGPGESGPVGPFPTGQAGIPGGVAARPLPPPTLSDPFAIGEALYEPGRMADAVVSMLHLMGIGIYDRDGSAILKGDERVPGDPWLTEDEVWLLIDVGVEDALAAGYEGPRHRLAELHEGLVPLLPQMALADFVAAYGDAYAANPDHLVPQLLLGQPVDASTGFTRTQLWLLYIDGFVELAEPATARLASGQLVAQAGPRPPSGTANAHLPQLAQPPAMSYDDFREIIAHLPTLVATLKITVGATAAHEGHGSPGQQVQVTAAVNPGQDFQSPLDGRVLLRGKAPSQIALEWQATDQAVLNAHGTLNRTLPFLDVADPTASLSFTPKREEADGRGLVAREWASIDVSVVAEDLIEQVYDIEPTLLWTWLSGAEITRSGGIDIEWHDKGFDLRITNTYNVGIEVSQGGVGLAHRKGVDTFRGTLTPRLDGLYYAGTLEATSKATSEMEFAYGVSGERCEDSTDSTQRLDVVGILVSAAPIDPSVDILAAGQFGTMDMVLRFYPASGPGGTLGRCQGTIEYQGPGPTCFAAMAPGQTTPPQDWSPGDDCPPGTLISGTYAAFSDSRITDPLWPGPLVIHLPPRDGGLQYEDWRQVVPEADVDSVFDIVVNAYGAP